VWVSEFQRRLAALEKRGADPDSDLYEKALAFREAMVRSAGRFAHPADQDETLESVVLSEALDEAKEIVVIRRAILTP
jgi:hypothetical protein